MTDLLNSLFKSWRGSTLQTIAAIILPLTLALVAVSFGSYFLHQNAMRAMVGERDERAVKASAEIIQSEVLRRKDSLEMLVRFASENDFTDDSLDQDTQGLFDRGLVFFQPNTSPIFVHVHPKLAEVISTLDEKEPFETVIQDGEPIVLVKVISHQNGNGLVGAFSANTFLNEAVAEDHLQHGNMAVYVFDQTGSLLFKNGLGSLEKDPVPHPEIVEGLAGKSGASFVQANGKEQVIAFSFIPATGWAIVMEESWEEVATPSLLTTQVTPLILIPALLLAALMLWFGAEQIVKPLGALEKKAAMVAVGDYQEIESPVNGIEEIRHLQRELALMARQVLAAQQSLHNYIGEITRGQEEERQRLALELHDETIQTLIALKQRAQLRIRALPKGDPTIPAMEELGSLTEDAINKLRRTIKALRPIYLEDFGLVTSLEMLSNENSSTYGIPFSYIKTGIERRLEPEVELAIYRIAQESLNNVGHHAKAQTAELKVEFTSEDVILQILDDGVGFIPPANLSDFMREGHFGLVGLHERAQLIGAKLEIHSTVGKGTHITLKLNK